MAGAGDGEAIFDCRDLAVDLPTDAGARRVLEDVSFQVRPGEFVTILGSSGVGKTTLLRALAGLVPVTEASTMRFNGADISGPPDGVVLVFQDYASSLLPWRTAAANVALGVERRLSRAEAADRVDAALELVGLIDYRDEYPWRLSGGMQQRVQLARALALQPKVQLMDEPFGALDAMTKADLQDQLLAIQRATGTTIVFITHDVEEAAYVGDRAIVLAGRPGRVALDRRIDLGSERDQVATRESPEYIAIRRELYEALHEQ